MADTWTCPSCGAKLEMARRQCPACRVTQIHRTISTKPTPSPLAPKRKEAIEVMLPCFIPDVRYSITLAGGGASWTTGLIYITTAGYYFLCDKDGFTTEAKAAEVAAAEISDQPKRIAALSIFAPRTVVKRLVHGQFTGNFLEMADLKIPLRLTTEGWQRIMGACRKLDVKVDA